MSVHVCLYLCLILSVRICVHLVPSPFDLVPRHYKDVCLCLCLCAVDALPF